MWMKWPIYPGYVASIYNYVSVVNFQSVEVPIDWIEMAFNEEDNEGDTRCYGI